MPKMINYMKVFPKTKGKSEVLGAQSELNSTERLVCCSQPIEYESLSPGLKVAVLLYQLLLENLEIFNFRL